MRRRLNVRLLAIVLGSLSILVLAVHFLHGYQLQQNAYRLLEAGDRAGADKDFDKALVYYGQYLAFVPNDADTVQKYAEALDLRADSPEERMRLTLLMEQVLRVKPNERDLRFRLIHNLISLDRLTEAIGHLRKLQNQWPDKAEALHMLGWCQEAKEDYLRAVQSFEQAVALDPKRIETYNLLIQVLSERRNLVEEAQKKADEMVQANPKSYRAYLVRAHFQRRRGDDAAADRDLESAFALAPAQPEVVLAVADAARAQGNWERATRLLQDGLKTHPNHADFYKLMVGLKLQSGQPTEALNIARDGLVNLPGSTELAVLLIDLLIDEKQYAEAKRKIDALVQAGVKPTLPGYLNARLLVADKKWTDALKLLEGVARDVRGAADGSGRVHALLGMCYRNLGDHERELQAYRRAVADEPGWLVGHLGLAAAQLDADRGEEAAQTLEAARPTSKLPPAYWSLLARCRLAQQMRLPPAEQRWDKVEEALANAGEDASIVHAAMQAARHEFADARIQLEKARADHPRVVAIRISLAELSVQEGRWDDAEKTLEEAVTDLGDTLELRVARSRLYAKRGGAQDRMKLTRLGEQMPAAFRVEQRVRLERELADAWQRLGEPNRAEKLLHNVARAVPRDLPSRLALLDIALDKRQTLTARALVDEIRGIEGEQGLHWRAGAIALQLQAARNDRSQLDDARRKLQELDKAHKYSPRLSLLSATLFELEGRPQQAIPEYQRALALGDSRPSTLARLIHLLVAKREFAAAEAELLKYERRAPLTKALARAGAEVALSLRDERYAKLAIARAEQAVSLPTRDYRDGLWLAHVYQEAGAYDKAERALEDCLAQAGYAPDVWIAWMEFLTTSNQRNRAAQELQRMAKELPKDRLPLTLARCHDALRQPDLAAKAYRAALQDRPDDFIVLSFAADYFDRADQAAEAQEFYERLLDSARAAPADTVVQARRRLAIILASENTSASRAQAMALLDENKPPTIADERIRLYVQGLASKTARREALDKFQKSLSQSPLTPDERVLYAALLDADGLPNQACSQLTEVVNEHPHAPHYLARFVHLLIRSGDLDEAERHWKRLESLEPASDRTRNLRMELIKAGS